MTTLIDRLKQERSRLEAGPGLNEKPGGAGTVRFVAKCPGNADSVLARAKEVLFVVNEFSIGNWADEMTWRKTLPSWFIDRCPPRRSREQVESELQSFGQLTPVEQIQRMRSADWPLVDWLEFFKPDKREWYWWDGTPIRNSFLAVAIEVNGWPFSWVSLSWLLRASGAIAVGEEEDFLGDMVLDELGIGNDGDPG